jgi:hypothetical protein
MQTHIYYLTLSSASPTTVRNLLATMPEKYKTSDYGTTIAEYNGQEDGSARVCFYMLTSAKANALRKWFYRRTRYKTGRGSFARLVTAKPKAAPVVKTPEPTLFDCLAAA